MHLDFNEAIAGARLAAAAFDIKAEPARLITARLRLWQTGKPVADIGESARISRRVRTRRAANRRLVDLDHLVAIFEAGNRLVLAGDDPRTVEHPRCAGMQCVHREG